MFDWLCSLFMGASADAALEAAIYSAGLASSSGMHQEKEPYALQTLANERKAKRNEK